MSKMSKHSLIEGTYIFARDLETSIIMHIKRSFKLLKVISSKDVVNISRFLTNNDHCVLSRIVHHCALENSDFGQLKYWSIGYNREWKHKTLKQVSLHELNLW